MRKRITLLLLLALPGMLPFTLYAQQETPYILNGTAVPETCNCYGLTGDQKWQAGSVWNKNKISLNQSFNYIFNVYLGCKNEMGADGIVFVLQPIGTSIGSQGQGLGFENIVPSIGIPIDTWQNFDFNDPYYDHTGIYKNGDLINGSVNTLAGPVPVLDNDGNIEDCKWHTFRIIWNADTKTLSAEVDNVKRVEAHTDLVQDIFGGAPEVYWGFTASTGGQSNVQKFCTSLNPSFSIPENTNSCAPALVPYVDHSTSFGTIVNWWWDFGDGTQSTLENPEPHAYPKPGNYTVKLNIKANNGCISDTFKQKIVVGSIPTAGYGISPSFICANSEILFSDMSKVEFGTINQWDWDFNNGAEQIQSATPGLLKTFPLGTEEIQLTVKTIEGCVSSAFTKTMDVTSKPATSISVQDACYGDPVPLRASSLTPDIPIRQWYWNTDDGSIDSSANPNHYFPAGGLYHVSVYAVNDAGCSSDTVSASLTIFQSFAKIGNDTIVAFGQPLQLHGSGGEFYEWMPAEGLNNPTISDPIAVLQNDMQYTLKAYTSFGCPTYDTIRIKAYKGPDIYVPNAFTPDHNGVNDYFHPVIVGMATIDYFEVFNRVGQKVFSSSGSGPGWDGTLDGRPQPVGAYVWLIRGKDYLGNMHSKKGTVVLIR
jgi:gliding motility-associated-like protein